MFLFKGNRSYLHSTDIINFIEKNYKYNQIDIRFYKLLRSQPKITLSKKNNTKANIIAEIGIKKLKKYLNFFETNQKIKNSYSYDENLLKNYFKINNQEVKCNFLTTIKRLDLIVSMSKEWHIKKINKKKIWMVVRINLKKMIIDSKHKNICVRISKITNKKYTVSDIYINEKHHGKIYYSVITL